MYLSSLIAAAMAVAAPQLVPGLTSDLNDYNFSVDAAERTLVFARSEADFRNARIFIADRREGSWSEPRPIPFSDDRYSDSDPWLTPDGRTLYFISTRPSPSRAEGRADYDIWRSVRTDSGWSQPEPLGSEVNSAGQELGPELHGDTLYFSSARRSGRGGLDVYAARAAGAGFEPASLLPEPINGGASESDFTLSADGRTAYFWRSGDGGTAAIHWSRREGGAWSQPEPLPQSVNVGPFNFTPSLSRDGRTLYFASTRERAGQAAGMADIYSVSLSR